MTRADVVSMYEVSPDGVIVSPGKFEGEMLYVPYFWDAYLSGFADRDNGRTIGFDITDEDRAEFPELKKCRTIRLIQTDSGFVCQE